MTGTSTARAFSPDYDVAIVGAGAAGLATAIFSRELNPERSVAVFDGARKPGAKILVSGGGRCNVTNAVVTERDFWGGRRTIIRQVLRAFTVEQTRTFFLRIGVPLHEEADGKLFPDSNRARDVLDALLRELDRVGARLHADHRVTSIARANGGFLLATSHGSMTARHVVLATGGRSVPKSGSDGGGYQIARALGHGIVPVTPALAPLVLDDRADTLHARLSGVSHDAELTLWIDGRASIRLTASLLWTHFGVSGPLALNISRHWERATIENRHVRVTLNFSPRSTFEDVDRRLVDLIVDRPHASIPTLLSAWLPASVSAAVVEAQDIEDVAATQLSRSDRRRLAHSLVEWMLPVTSTRGYNYAEATAGGVPLTEIEPRTMRSRMCPGLYVVGEVLDVDGRIGGFNFQWAWSSARGAALSLARSEPSPLASRGAYPVKQYRKSGSATKAQKHKKLTILS